MATPVSYFKHPHFLEDGFFFVHNTFFELPETIPMDLASFVYYHHVSKRSLRGFINAWDNIKKLGTSLSDYSFDELYSEHEKERLFKDLVYSNAHARALKNRAFSRDLENLLNSNKVLPESLESYLKEYGQVVFHPQEFYYSQHQLVNFLWNELNVIIDLHDEGNALAMIYSNSFLPLELIPHKFRNSFFFKQHYLKSGKEYLIPKNDSSETVEIDFVNDYETIHEILCRHGDLYKFVGYEHRNNVDLFEVAMSSSSNIEALVYPYAGATIRQNMVYKHIFSEIEMNKLDDDDLPF